MPSMKHLEGIPDETVRRVLQAADDVRIALVVQDPRFIEFGSAAVTAEQAALYMLDQDAFWMSFHGVTPEKYHPWRKHIDRMDHGAVPCLGWTAGRRPCGNMVPAAPDPKKYDPVIHDYCRHHGDQCPT